MNRLILAGGTLITPSEERFTNLTIVNGIIEEITNATEANDAEVLDVSGCYVTPGLVDLQLNGGPACSFWESPTADEVERLCDHLVTAGVTTFLPTLITADIAHIRKNLEFLEQLGVGKNRSAGASYGMVGRCKSRMPGVHLEGPCLSPLRPGVHPPQWLQPLNRAVADELICPSVVMMTVAPELDPSGEVVNYLANREIVISLGHSNATFEEANQAFDRGVAMITHTYNAMPPLNHRAPGAVMAALLDDRVSCAIICDGLHVDPAAVKLLLKCKGVDRVILVTDAAQIGTTGGGLVGSSIDLCDAVRNLVAWRAASFADAIKMATLNPSRSLKVEDKVGQLKPGSCADIVIWDKESLQIRKVFSSGKIVFSLS